MAINFFRKSAIQKKIKEVQAIAGSAPRIVYTDRNLTFTELFEVTGDHSGTVAVIHTLVKNYFDHLGMPTHLQPELNISMTQVSAIPNFSIATDHPIKYDGEKIVFSICYLRDKDGNDWFSMTDSGFDALLRREIVRAYVHRTYGIMADDFLAEVFVSFLGLDTQATTTDMSLILSGKGTKKVFLNALTKEEVVYIRSLLHK